MRKIFIILLLLLPKIFLAETIYIPKLTYEEAQNLYDSYRSYPRNMTVVIGDPYDKRLDNHSGWSHITRHLTFNNFFSCIKTVTNTTFLACFGAAVLIQKSYAAIKKIDDLFNKRCIAFSFNSEESVILYKQFKKYELLFFTYKKLHTLLTKTHLRSYFSYDINCEETIDYALTYISLYEKKQLQLTDEIE